MHTDTYLLKTSQILMIDHHFHHLRCHFFGYTVYPILSQTHLDYPLTLKLFVESLEFSGPLRVALVTMVTMVTMEKAERAA